MSCVTSISFAILINGLGSPFFESAQGLRQGSPLSPYLFLLVVDGLSREIANVKRVNKVQGVRMSRYEHITHLLLCLDLLLLFGS